MYLTQETLKQIEEYFKRNSIRDSEFPTAGSSLSGEEFCVIVKDNKNVKVKIKDLIQPVLSQTTGQDDKIGMSQKAITDTINEAIKDFKGKYYMDYPPERGDIHLITDFLNNGNDILFVDKKGSIYSPSYTFINKEGEVTLDFSTPGKDAGVEKIRFTWTLNFDGTQLLFKQDKYSITKDLSSLENSKQSKNDSSLETKSKTIVGSINELNNNKVTVVKGKQLSTEDFTTAEKEKLSTLTNYDDSEIIHQLELKQSSTDNSLQTQDKTVSGAINELNANKQNSLDSVGKKTTEGGEAFNLSTVAGRYAHSEGNSKAIGMMAHAEGVTTEAKGIYSHAEGRTTKAIAESSHTEGEYTEAHGTAAHAEGLSCIANNNYTHSEGYATRADNECEHSQGSWNISHKGATDDLKSIHTIGIGTQGNQQNAITVMKNGDLYVKGVGSYDGTNPDKAETIQVELNKKADLAYVNTEDAKLQANITANNNLIVGQQSAIDNINAKNELQDKEIELAKNPKGGQHRKLLENAGGIYHEDTDDWELNGEKGIPTAEMELAYFGYPKSLSELLGKDFNYCYTRANIRTNFCLTNDFSWWYPAKKYEVKGSQLCAISKMRTLVLPVSSGHGLTQAIAFKGERVFYNASYLEIIIGYFNVIVPDWMGVNEFGNAKMLASFTLFKQKGSVYFNECPKVSYASYKFMVDNWDTEDTSGSIRVHPTTMTYFDGTATAPTEVGGTKQEWADLLALAKTKQITITA